MRRSEFQTNGYAQHASRLNVQRTVGVRGERPTPSSDSLQDATQHTNCKFPFFKRDLSADKINGPE
eukprot:m.368851 g.368851  ORF g.368851 m.368851 type:complete len:66 (-) comp20843_c0_seq18:5213-5410(-)